MIPFPQQPIHSLRLAPVRIQIMMDSMGIFPDFEKISDRLQCQVVIFVKSVQRAVALDKLLVRDPVG